MTVSVKVDARSLTRSLKRARRTLNSPHIIFGQVERMLLRVVEKNFQEEGRPKWKARKNPATHPILSDTETLRNSIRASATSRGVQLSSDVVYAAVHQFGSKDRTTPARPFLTVPPNESRRIADAVEDLILGAFR